MSMTYREHPALVMDVTLGTETPAPVVWGNADGQDVIDFQDVLDTTVRDYISQMNDTRLDGITPRQVIVRAYAMRIPEWLTRGYEKDYIIDWYPDPRSRQLHRDFTAPMYGYQFEVWE